MRLGVLSLLRLGRGAEARSSRADVPRSFGGPSERCSRFFRRSRRRQSRRGGWGARLTPAHCHPRNRMERYRGAWRILFLRAASLFCAPFLPSITIAGTSEKGDGCSSHSPGTPFSRMAFFNPPIWRLAFPGRACPTSEQNYCTVRRSGCIHLK
jgi:hypothetical protein